MRISDWSSDVCSSDLPGVDEITLPQSVAWQVHCVGRLGRLGHRVQRQRRLYQFRTRHGFTDVADAAFEQLWTADRLSWNEIDSISASAGRSEEHTSELQSLMRISYAVLCLNKKQ